MLEYYVYAYLNKQTLKPYYIGKGKNYRYKERHSVEIPEDKYIVFLETGLTEVGALALERRLIRWWGRVDTLTGILLNKTEGGEGSYNPSPEALKARADKMVATRRANNTYNNEVAQKAIATKKANGQTIGFTKEMAKLATETKRQNDSFYRGGNPNPVTSQLVTEEAKAKAKATCARLAAREIVDQLRILAKSKGIKLGSGWVRKSDNWILTQIELLSNHNDHS